MEYFLGGLYTIIILVVILAITALVSYVRYLNDEIDKLKDRMSEIDGKKSLFSNNSKKDKNKGLKAKLEEINKNIEDFKIDEEILKELEEDFKK